MSGERWSSSFGFVLAAMGSAIGLGSIWKFPYEAGANGGGSFVIPYLLGLVGIVVPLLLAEFVIGRAGRGDAVKSLATVATASGRSTRWSAIGAAGIVTGFLILSFYAVIGGWALSYAFDALLGARATTPEAIKSQFDALLASPARMLLFHALFMGAAGLIVAGGVERGIETASRILMPGLFFMIAGLAVYSMSVGDSRAALRFLFSVDFEKLTPRVWLDAIGLGFFSIGVGLGSMITYAAYAGSGASLRKIALATVLGDTLVSFLAGLAIFPLVFAYGLDPAGGPGLMFVTLPVAFAKMPLGGLLGFTFYVLLVVSALGSAISLLELVVAWLMTKRGLSRVSASSLAGVACWLAGIPTALSFSQWREWWPLAGFSGFERATVFDLLDFLTSNVLLPLCGFALAIFAGWLIPRALIALELDVSDRTAWLLQAILKYVAPGLVVLAVLAPWFAR